MARPSLPLAVTLVLAISAVAVVGAVDDESPAMSTPVTTTTPGAPNHLAINDTDVERRATTRPDLDVGSAIATDSSDLRATFLTLQFDAAYENASSEAARAAVVDRFADEFGNRTAALETRSRENVAAYATGSISAERFLRERAQIQSRAERLEGALSDLTGQVPRSLQIPFYSVDGHLEVLQGPVSATAVDRLVTGRDGQSIYVEVSNTGYTLARIADREYTRETYLHDARYPERPDQFENGTGGLLAAQNRIFELYPWVRNNQRNPSAASGVAPGIYRVTRGFPGGELRVYLSGGTTEVFREAQTRTLPSFNATEVINRTSGSLRLTVNRTYETGPAQVTLRDATSGQPVNGTVAVGGRDPIPIGEDGTYWFVEPRGVPRVNVTAGSTDFSFTLSGS